MFEWSQRIGRKWRTICDLIFANPKFGDFFVFGKKCECPTWRKVGAVPSLADRTTSPSAALSLHIHSYGFLIMIFTREIFTKPYPRGECIGWVGPRGCRRGCPEAVLVHRRRAAGWGGLGR